MSNIKLYIILCVVLAYSSKALAQVDTEILSERIYELSVIQVFPDSFPVVEVIFQARNQVGQPLWGVSKTDISVEENERPCRILELVNMSEQDIIDIALVFDHSGSMGFPPLPASMTNETMSRVQYDSIMLLPKAIDYAKVGVLSFTSSTDLSSDSILIVGFSSEVDEIVGPTQNIELLESKVRSMQSDNGTAFYDALIETIHHMSLKPDQKKAIVALTDGQDNESKSSFNDVITKAVEYGIPIYVIGLGNVLDSTLQLIADGTDGFFYKTDDPKLLEQIYLNISRQLKSVYKLKYESELEGFINDDQTIRFGFVNDTLSFINPDIRMSLPASVIQYIHDQEDSRRLEELRDRNILIGGAGAGLVVLGLTTFLLFRRSQRKKLTITNIYPNPFADNFSIEIESGSHQNGLQLDILSANGVLVQSEKIESTGVGIDINASNLPKGNYVIRVINSEGQFDTIKAVKK
jgi:hypothetical protein